MRQVSTKLFCLPYAGSSAYNYLVWSRYFDKSVKILPIELKGRGSRLKEPFYDSFQEAVDDAYTFIETNINEESEYAIFGHSMGGLLAYEVCMKIMENEGKLPESLIISGKNPPNVKEQKIEWSNEKKILETFEAIPITVWNNPNLKKIFIPILHADCKILNQYQFDDKREKLNIDIDVFFGKDDITTPLNKIEKWNELTVGSCSFHSFPGKHFYLKDDMQRIVNEIEKVLCI